MQDLNDKNTGSTLTATEWNEVPSELQNAIEGTGQTLSGGDLNQLGKCIADYVANGTFYTDSGITDAYVLTTVGSKQSPTAYTDGFEIAFRPANTNTGSSTVNVAGLGPIILNTSTGGSIPAGSLVAGQLVKLRYKSSSNRFQLPPAVVSAGAIIQVATVTVVSQTTTTTVMPFDNTIPQITEGAALTSLAFTPKFADSTLLIIVDSYCSINTGVASVGAIFKDAVANAIYATASQQPNLVDTPTPMKMIATDPAVNTSSRTYSLRMGPASAGTLTLNGAAAGPKFSNAPSTSLTVMEIAA